MASADMAGERRPSIFAALSTRFLAERERWPLWFPVLMGAGIAIYFMLATEPAWWIGASALTLASAVLIVARWRYIDLTAAAAVFAVALGFAAAQFETWMVAAPVLQHRLGPVEVMGRLVSLEPMPEGARLVIAPTQVGDLDAA